MKELAGSDVDEMGYVFFNCWGESSLRSEGISPCFWALLLFEDLKKECRRPPNSFLFKANEDFPDLY